MWRIVVVPLIVLLCGVVVVVSGQDSTHNLRLIADRDLSLTVYVTSSESVSLNGLALRVVSNLGTFQTFRLDEGFNSLRLTGGFALPGSCFIYIQAGTTPTLPNVCSQPNRVFRMEVARVDLFWYDFNTNRQRDIAIVSYDEATGDICPASSVECEFTYIAPATVTPAPSTTLTATLKATHTPGHTPTATATTVPLGFSGYPVTANTQWTPQFQTFDGVEMALVPVGCFWMGSRFQSDEQPVHEICFDEPFWIDTYEVTNVLYGSSGLFSGDNRPRESVSWYEAREFCESRALRLPTEAEWEYAARGPDNLIYPWGDDFIADNTVYVGNSDDHTAFVGSKPNGASWVGVQDMGGNVWEWTSSIYREYPYSVTDGRESRNDTGSWRALRGGSFLYEGGELRTSRRHWAAPDYGDHGLGFRCTRDFQPEDLTP